MNAYTTLQILILFADFVQVQGSNAVIVWTTANPATISAVVGNPDLYLAGDSTAYKYYSMSFGSDVTLQSIAYDASNGRMAFVDTQKKAIIVKSLLQFINKDSNNLNYFDLPLSNNIAGLAFAAKGNMLYWADANNKYIGVADLVHQNWTKLITTGLQAPVSVAVYEDENYLFWGDMSENPKIERSDLFGNGRKIIVNTNLSRIFNLVVEKQTKKLYWFDDKLKRCDFEGYGFKSLGMLTINYPNIGYALYKDIVYYYNNVTFVVAQLSSSGGIIFGSTLMPIVDNTQNIISASLDWNDYDTETTAVTKRPGNGAVKIMPMLNVLSLMFLWKMWEMIY